MHFVLYDRDSAVEYAKRWAKKRNGAYMNFDGLGGDCTNFASQCLFAGVGVMNYSRDVGWYYNSPSDRAAAWSHAQYFKRFMLNNNSVGPVASSVNIHRLEMGDFICLSNGAECYHTLVVTGFSKDIPLVCAHTDDSYMRRLDTYYYTNAYGIHILGANKY